MSEQSPILYADESSLFQPKIIEPIKQSDHLVLILFTILVVLLIVLVYVICCIRKRQYVPEVKKFNCDNGQTLDGPEGYFLQNGTYADYEYAIGLRKPFDNPDAILKKGPKEDQLYAQIRQL